MIFYKNRLLAEGSHEISFFFFQKFGKVWQKLISVAVVIGSLRVNLLAH